MAVKIQHLRSDVANKRPTGAGLLDGELALNIDSGTPGAFFKDELGAVIKVGPAEVGSTAPNGSPASGGSSGNTPGEFWFDTSNSSGNSIDLLKVYDGSSFVSVGSVTIGSTNIELGAAATTTISGLTALTAQSLNATSDIDLENQADLRFYEATANGTNYVGFQAPSSISADVLWTLPAADGTADQVLSTNGSGVLSWSEARTNDITQGDTSVTVTDTGTDGNIAFVTDGLTRWNINNSGHLVPGTDSTYNVGANGNEVNHVYTDNLTVQTDGTFNGTSTFVGLASFNGNVDLGDANTDTVTFTAKVDSDVLPSADATYDLGASGSAWAEVHAGSLYGTVQEVTVLKSLTGDSGTATATAQTLQVSGGTALTSSATGTTLTIDLDDTAVTPGSYGSATAIPTFTVDQQGRLTAASSVSVATTLNTAGDSGTGSVSLLTQTLTISGGTGLTAAASAQSITIDLDNTAVSAGSYGSASAVPTYTVDAQGRLTAAANVTIDILHTQVSDFDTGVRTNRLDQMAAPTADVSLNSQKITNLADPIADSDAANKGYVDSVAQGLDVKGSCLAATTGNITLTGTQTIDGVSVGVGDRVLVKNQTTASQNGIYVASAGAWARSDDADTWEKLVSAFVFVEEGSTNADNGYVCIVDGGGTLGTTDVVFEQFSGAGQITAGDGLSKSGNTLNVNPDSRASGTKTIAIVSDEVRIDSAYVGQTSLTTLGTITTGTWNGSIIGLAYGGTGVNNTSISQNYAFLGPNTGGAGNPTWREILTSDIAPVTGGSFDAGTY